jgi:3-deoxy-manno-octulosonate cytidylyltransferase (CMP-KDO synthetase)
MEVCAIIPARFASTRLPGKPLLPIHGRPMIQWVYEATERCSSIDHVLVATDDERIAVAVKHFGGSVVMTDSNHQSGTARIIEAVNSLRTRPDLVINVQGDEPAIDPEHLAGLMRLFETAQQVDIGTLITPIKNVALLQNPNCVKAVVDQYGKALYFSRAAIPHNQSGSAETQGCYQHLGVYAYRMEALNRISSLAPSLLAQRESLEQLTWLEHGLSVYTSSVASAPKGVDTPEDLEFIRSFLKA